MFKKFTNKNEKSKEALTKDMQGLLSLYETTHLRVHGEAILEKALNVTIPNLESIGPKLSNWSLKAEVSVALSQTIHTNLPRLGARKYIAMYENIESHNDFLLKFAKMDFSILQKVHQRELSELTRYTLWSSLYIVLISGKVRNFTKGYLKFNIHIKNLLLTYIHDISFYIHSINFWWRMFDWPPINIMPRGGSNVRLTGFHEPSIFCVDPVFILHNSLKV